MMSLNFEELQHFNVSFLFQYFACSLTLFFTIHAIAKQTFTKHKYLLLNHEPRGTSTPENAAAYLIWDMCMDAWVSCLGLYFYFVGRYEEGFASWEGRVNGYHWVGEWVLIHCLVHNIFMLFYEQYSGTSSVYCYMHHVTAIVSFLSVSTPFCMYWCAVYQLIEQRRTQQ